MGKRARKGGVTNAAVRAARAAWQQQDDGAAAVAQRVYNAVHEAKTTGEAGDVSPLLWGPLVVAAEMAAAVVVKANGLPDTEEQRIEVAAYFTAGFLSGAHGFDFAHFERWRQRTADGAEQDPEPG
jgi:hypothetical protein